MPLMKGCTTRSTNWARCSNSACDRLLRLMAAWAAFKIVKVPAPVGAICDADGTGCTKGDACNTYGNCVAGPNVDCSITSDCASGACLSTSAQTYLCNGAWKADGTLCDADNSGCTIKDSCLGGVCKAGTAVDCGASSVQCQAKSCLSTGQDMYTCQSGALPDKTVCDADQNGCTVGDACASGVCYKGATQDCSSFINSCTQATCASTSSTAYVCNVKSMTSYPPLSPSVSCVTGASPSTCPTGYNCVTGQCLPSVTLSCSDGNLCTPFDYCSAGTCVGAPANCDDGDTCTTDSCDPKTGSCVHTAIAGCGICLTEYLATTLDANAVVRSRNAAIANWAITTDGEVTWSAATWQDPAATPSQTSLLMRKLYLESTGPSQLDFDVTVSGNNADCAVASLGVLVNNVNVKNVCDASVQTHVTVPLTAWTGAPVDIAFSTGPGSTKPTSTVVVAMSNIKVKGMCTTSCVGVDFEPRDSGNPAYPYVMPQSWKATTTDVTYASWATSAASGHTGTSELLATWTGAPTSGTPQVAKMTIPRVSVVAGNFLNFAFKTSFGDQTCGADDLSVRVVTATGVVELLKQCSNSSGWLVKSYDLSAFVNTTVDIDLVVTTGASSAAAGTVEIDDIAITGTCTYLCLNDDFESGGLAKWTTASTDSGSKFKPFAANTTTYQSASTSAFAQYDSTSTNGKMVYMTGDISKGTFLQLPVLGATLSMAVNAFSATPPSDCATNAASGIFWFRVTEPSASVVTTVASLSNAGPAKSWECSPPTTGWGTFQTPVSPSATLDVVTPNFYVVKQAGSASGKIYIDDVQVICQ